MGAPLACAALDATHLSHLHLTLGGLRMDPRLQTPFFSLEDDGGFLIKGFLTY